MIFHSLDYLVFLVAVFGLYWCLPRRPQNLLLLGASYFFYGYVHPWYLGLLAFTSLVDFLVANGMSRYPQQRKKLLCATLLTNFGILCSFKYLNFLTGGHAVDVVHGLGFTWLSPAAVAALLPVGISFYTFQSASYVVDVYRGQLTARRSVVDYLLFVSFFPQLVAGPIERASRLLSQLELPRTFDLRLARGAITLILWGLFKKVAIADQAAVVANKVFSLQNPPFPMLWAGVFAFGIQIYADFSAYTDIARGSGRLLGFDLMENFRHPYLSPSPTAFWRRWHISLSTWFRDYVFIPLGGNKCSPGRVRVNLMLVFLISGLWHGASWNFVLWGAFHGLLLVIWQSWKKAPTGIWGILLTYALVNVGWLFFREQNLAMLWHYLTLNPLAATLLEWQAALYRVVLVCFFSWPLLAHALMDHLLQKHHAEAKSAHYPGWYWTLGQALLATLLFLGILLLRAVDSSAFIYFQF